MSLKHHLTLGSWIWKSPQLFIDLRCLMCMRKIRREEKTGWKLGKRTRAAVDGAGLKQWHGWIIKGQGRGDRGRGRQREIELCMRAVRHLCIFTNYTNTRLMGLSLELHTDWTDQPRTPLQLKATGSCCCFFFFFLCGGGLLFFVGGGVLKLTTLNI